MRILCIAVYRSNHCDRHVNLLARHGHDVHLAVLCGGADEVPLHAGVTVHAGAAGRPPEADGPVAADGGLADPAMLEVAKRAMFNRDAGEAAAWLAGVIDTLRPDVLHSFSLHQTSFLTLAARQLCRQPFPPWIVSNWGCDIHFFGREPDYRAAIEETLRVADGYFAECARDVALARRHGFRGATLAVQPIGGGFDLEWFQALRSPGATSRRRLVMVKGYQSSVGRADTALEALRRVGTALSEYRVAVYARSPSLSDALDAFERETGVPVVRLPYLSFSDLMRLHGMARCSVGVSLSDGICTSAMEAVLMGSLPIQSDTSCLTEWTGSRSVLTAPAEDVDALADAVRRAVTDDSLVDGAVARNDAVLRERLSEAVVNPRILAMYERAAAIRR
ncbi:glycosyltransferase [Azospirillum sp. ST 5-10]|uniref:glycosyltransferase n=1 Tax=unclassified Azospirillum TaxID=2630922 RepID=UPI003F4A66AD